MWSYIVKAINNDLSKPLNNQIGKLNDVNGYKFTPRMEWTWSNQKSYIIDYEIIDIKYDSTHVFVATEWISSTPDGYLYKFSKSDYSYTRISEGNLKSIAVDDTHVYVADAVTNNVKKYLKSDLSLIGSTSGLSHDINSICVNDTHLFAGSSDNTIKKYLKSDLSLVATSPDFGDDIKAIALGVSPFDPTGLNYDMIFAVGSNVIKNYNIADLSVITSKTEADISTFDSLTVDSNYVYAGNVDKFIQYTDGLLGKVSTINAPANRLENDTLHVYAKGGTSGIKKYLKSNFSLVSESDGFSNDVISVDGNNIYAGTTLTNVDQFKVYTEKTFYDGYNVVKKITSEQDLTYQIKHFEIDT